MNVFTARWRARPVRSFCTVLLLLFLVPAEGIAEPKRPPVPVNAVPVEIKEVNERIRIVGTLEANESVVIRPEISGRVTEIHFREGSEVAAGEKLFSLDAAVFGARLQRYEAEVRLAKLSFNRAKNLRSDRAISQQEYDEAESLLLGAQARRDESRAQLDKTLLRAPFDGILGLRRVSLGAYVRPGDDLVNLENIDPLKVDFKISERYAPVLHAGQQFDLAVDAFPRQEFVGRISAIDPRLDPATRTFVIRGVVGNPEHRLKPGMFSRISLTVAERKGAVMVPEEAIFPVADQLFVYKVVEETAVKTLVQTGTRGHGEVEIVDGLQKGDLVITAGHLKIRDGSAVSLLP